MVALVGVRLSEWRYLCETASALLRVFCKKRCPSLVCQLWFWPLLCALSPSYELPSSGPDVRQCGCVGGKAYYLLNAGLPKGICGFVSGKKSKAGAMVEAEKPNQAIAHVDGSGKK